MSEKIFIDYSLTGENAKKALEKGLAEATWYQTPIERETLRQLLERKDGPAIRDTLIWLTLLIGSGILAYQLWGSWWAILPFIVYGAIYASTSDSRWHETSHGTAFKTDWMNNLLYEVSSFMVMREATVWRWSHNRHHSDTIIIGRDPEIAVPKPPNIPKFLLVFTGLVFYRSYFPSVFNHALGKISEDEKTFIPETEYGKVIWRARIYLSIYLIVIALSIYYQSILPLMFIGLPTLYGSWLMPIYGNTQHAGLADNVLDHRLNCRTVYMNPVNRFLYWNMNYHVEHHMFPLVPYHALPKLHEIVKWDMPKPYQSIWEAYCELFPAIVKQSKDPSYFVKRELPETQKVIENHHPISNDIPDKDGWLYVMPSHELAKDRLIRFDHNRKTYAIARTLTNELYAIDGICSHGNNHLADGLIIDKTIECPKHNGRFHLNDGTPARTPICQGLTVYPVKELDDGIWINVLQGKGENVKRSKSVEFRVVSNNFVASFIKELVIEPVIESEKISFTPGDYLQFVIPEYERIDFNEWIIPEKYSPEWENIRSSQIHVSNHLASGERKNNYSIASSVSEKTLRFNIRIALAPNGLDVPPGIGSSYMFNLKEGDIIKSIGPYGDFHIKPTPKEMVYIGGGAGMAPIRSHISYLLGEIKSDRKISFWYGARSTKELFYTDYFEELMQLNSNFSFHIGLSESKAEDNWDGYKGFIHEITYENYLKSHQNIKNIEFYLCGPPMMISATKAMLVGLGVSEDNILFDEF